MRTSTLERARDVAFWVAVTLSLVAAGFAIGYWLALTIFAPWVTR